MKPSIVITSNTLGFGGAERQRVQLANGLVVRGYDVTLTLLQDDGPLLSEVSTGVAVVRTRWQWPRPNVRGDAVVVTGTTNTEAGFGALWRGAGTLTGGRRRWVFAEHTPPEPDRPTHHRGLGGAMRASDGVIALSASHWEMVTAHQRLHRRPAWLVPNGAPDVARSPGPQRSPGNDGPLRLAFIGRLVEHKNVQVLLSSLSSLSALDWTLDVFGDGPYHTELLAQVPPALEGRVRFRGWVPTPSEVLAHVDLLLLPSRREAFPMVLLEAMSLGVPVMATASGAVPEMLEEGSGVVVPDGSVEAWRSAMSRVLEADRGALRDIAARGQERASAVYTQDRMVDGYEQVFADVLGRQLQHHV